MDQELIDNLSGIVPELTIESVIAKTGKSIVLLGYLREQKVAVKVYASDDAQWRPYFENEVDTYSAFQVLRPTFCVPDVFLLNKENSFIILQYLPNSSLRRKRYPESPPSAEEWERITSYLDKVSKYQGIEAKSRDEVCQRYEAKFKAAINKGYLEDADLQFLEQVVLHTSWTPEFNHGDPLLSNFIRISEDFYLVDWEYGGNYLPGYDDAVLSAILIEYPEYESKTRHRLLLKSEGYYLCFLANALIIASREVRLHSELPADQPLRRRLPLLTSHLRKVQAAARAHLRS